MLPALVGLLLLPPKTLDFYAQGPYDPSVPRPESVLRYEIGSRITTFRDQEDAVLAIAGRAPGRVKTIEYGRSTQGRPLRIFAISSPRNMARLESIRKDLAAISEGKADAATIARTPAVVWINECIHGNEPASFESAMPLLYNLAASRPLEKMLDDTLVILNPVYNPDGHERFAVYYNSVAVGASDPRAFEQGELQAMWGRFNQYRFDMNRDRVAFSQDETRQEVAELLRWNPQVYVDQHGQVDTYFMPPNPMSVNGNVDRDRFNKWTDIFGRATAEAFDKLGYSYFIKRDFDLYAAVYLDSFTSFTGAIGMTHETDGGKQLAKERGDGTVLTLRRGIEKHFTSALAVIRSAAARRQDLVSSYAAFKQRTNSGEAAGKFQRVVMVSEDPRPLVRLQEHLARMGVRSRFAAKSFSQKDANDYWSAGRGDKTFPAGSLVVDMAQPQGVIAKVMLEPQSTFEPEFVKAQLEKNKTAPEGEIYPGPDRTEFYDLTAWALPYAYSLKAWWCETAPAIEAAAAAPQYMAGRAEPSSVGYAIPYSDLADALAAFDALRAGVRGMIATKAMKVGGVTLAPGTFLFLDERNEEGYEQKLRAAVEARGARLVPLRTQYPDDGPWGPGSEITIPLRRPEVAVVFGDLARPSEYGATWYLMERVFRIPFTPITQSALNGDLSKFTCIVLPGGATGTPKLKEWVGNGGVAIALDRVGWALGSSSWVDLKKVEGEIESLPGSLYRANLDARSFLAFGYDAKEISVPVYGNTFYTSRKEGGTVVRLSEDEKATKLLSGWTFKDTEKNLRNAVWLQDVPVGDGHAVLFMQDPFERAMWPGLYKLVMNAMLVGR